MSFLGLSGPIVQPLAEAATACNLVHSVVHDADYVSPWWASVHGLVSAFQCGLDELNISGHAKFVDPRILAFERDLCGGDSGVWGPAIDIDGRPSQQVVATGVSTTSLGIAHCVKGEASAPSLTKECTDDCVRPCTGRVGCLPRAKCQHIPISEVSPLMSALHRCRHPVPLRVSFENSPKVQYNAWARAFSRLTASLSHQPLQSPPPCTASAESKVGSLSSLALYHHDGPAHLQLPIPKTSATTISIRAPTALQRVIAEALPLTPGDLAGPVLHQPVRENTGLLSQAAQDGDYHKFSVFDVTFHLQVRNRGPDWSLLDCIADAVSSAGTRTKAVQLIRHPMPGLPEPQLVLTPASAPVRASALPIDLRGYGFSVYTVEAEPGQSAEDIFTALQSMRAGRRSLLHNGLEPSALDFQDSQTRITTLLQDSVADHEWVQLVSRVRRPLHDLPAAEVPETNPLRSGVNSNSGGRPTTSTTTTPFDQSFFRRPVNVPRILEQVEILPSGVLTAPGAHLSVSNLGLFQLVTRGTARCTPFLFLVRGCVPIRLDGAREWTLLDFCSAAASNAECIPRRVQVLTSPLPGLLQPQIVVTDQIADATCELLPIDLRAAPGGDVVPVLLRPGMSTSQIASAIVEELPDSQPFFDEARSGDGFHFQDAEGFIWDELPSYLSALQWIVLRRGPAPSTRDLWPITSTTTTAPGIPSHDLRKVTASEATCLSVDCDVVGLSGRPTAAGYDALQAPLPQGPLMYAGMLASPCKLTYPGSCPPQQAILVDVKANSRPPDQARPIVVPPEGPPPNPDRDPRTPRGPSSSRPSNADMLRAAQIQVLPPEVAEAAVYTAPVGAFSWTSADHGVHTGTFSVFDARRHHLVDRAHQYATLQEVVALAVAHAPFQIAAVQVLTQTVRGLPKPQLVLHEAGRPPHESPLVWDLRGIQEPVLTCRHLPREMRDDALNKLQRIPGFLRDLKVELAQGSIALFDSLGSLPEQFPSNLHVMQHVRVTAFTGPSMPASTHTGPARQTGIMDVTSRGARPRIGPVRQHPPGLRITVLRGQHRFSVDCTFDNDAIDSLVLDLLRQHHAQAILPPSFFIVLGGAQPLRMGYFQEIAFVVQEGDQVATIWDGRHLGQELQVNLHSPGQSTCQVLDNSWTGNGWRLFVNGVPEAAAMRHIRFGDYLQPCSGTQCPGVVPLGSVLALCPALRPYAWPLEIVLSGTGFSAPLRRRRKQLGSHRMPEGTARVYGPHHGEVFLQLGTGHTPTALQVDTALQGLEGFPDGLSVIGTPTRHPHDADFVTRYRFRQDSTVLTPAPGHVGHLLVLLVHADIETLAGVPANPRIMLYPQRGLRHGDVLQQIPEPHFVFGEESEEEPTASDPAGPPPPEPVGSGGTSLACIPSRRAPRKQIIFDRPRAPAAEANNPSCSVPLHAQPRISIATPLGRRSLPSNIEAPPPCPPPSTRTQDASDNAQVSHATVLCLTELVPAAPQQTATSTDWGLRFQVPDDMPRFAFERFALCQATLRLPENIKLHPAAAALLSGLPCVQYDRTLDALCCFVDGSFKDQTATWAVAYIGFQAGRLCWAGYRAGVLPAQYACTSAFEGELFAQLVAYATIAEVCLPAVVCYDAKAAASVTQLQTAKTVSSQLAKAAGAVYAYVKAQGRPVFSDHTPSHQGCPGNELADSLARHTIGCPGGEADVHNSVHIDVAGQAFDWLWLRSPGMICADMPDLNEHGDTAPVLPSPGCLQPCTPADFGPSIATVPNNPSRFTGFMCTYNTLSSRTCLQRRCLDQFMQQQGIDFLALQETHECTQPVQKVGQTLRLSGSTQDGQFGCQVWLRLASAWHFDPRSVSIHYQDPRLLVVLVTAGMTRLALISAHAKASTHTDEDIRLWWTDLHSRLLALPPSVTPLIGIDANARFQWSEGVESPCNLNGHCLEDLCRRFSLVRTAAHEPDGRPRITWRPPTGPGVCLDYLLCPADWSPQTCVRTDLPLLDVHAGIDHNPIGLQLDVLLQPPPRRSLCVDRSAMMGPEGQARIQGLLSAMPAFPWHMDVDDHLLLLQAQIRHHMQVMFPKAKSGPRKPTISQDTWALLRLRRHHRRINRCKTQAYHRWLLYQCFRAWRNADERCQVVARLQGEVKARDYAAATHMRAMRDLSRQIRQASKADEAAFSRQAIQDARARGPAALAHSIRAVLKHGRRYKPASAAPALECNGDLVSDHHLVKLQLGRQFARAEQATEVQFPEMSSGSPVCPHAPILVQDMPTLVALAAAFAGLKCGKASGLSQIPTELYKAAPYESALLYMPIILKACARGTWPALWRGVEAVGLLKPNKPPRQPSSFRSIALLDNSGKAATKACRHVLSEKLEGVVLPSMGGARAGIPLELAALTVQGHLEMLQRSHCAGAVLFIDGISAFYATDRRLLFPRTPEAMQAHLSSLPIEQSVADRFFSKAGCKGALSKAGVSDDLIHLLNTTYVGTWYTTDPTSDVAFSTSCGTLPGAPLADIGFQYVILAALEALQEHMIAEHLQVQIPLVNSASFDALPVSWLDDLAILLKGEAQILVAQITRTANLVQQYLRIAGVEVNFSPGKSEILIHWAGPNSKKLREQVMVKDRARIRVPDFAGKTQFLHCVSRYVHLGSLRDHKADLQEEVQRRAALTREAYHPVRKRLLSNHCFTRAERQGMFVSFVLSRFLHGAGTWAFRDAASQAVFVRRYMSFARGAVRPLWGVPCRRLTESQVCSLVNCLSPLEALACARLRTLAQIAGRGTDFLRILVAKATLWIDEAVQDVEHMAKVLQDVKLQAFVDSRSPTPGWIAMFPYSSEHVRGLIRRYRNSRLKLRADLVDPAVRKASTLEKAEEAGLRVVHWPESRQPAKLYLCGHCTATFETAAARAAHEAKVHSQAAPAAAAVGSACQACMKEFWTTKRLREHLRKSRRCVQSYNGADLDPEAPVIATAEAVVLPPTMLIGPRPFWASLAPPLPSRVSPTPGVLEQILATANHSGKDFYHSFLKTRARLVETDGRQAVIDALAEAVALDSSWHLAASLPFPEDLDNGEYRVQCGKTVILARNSAILLGPSEVIQRLAGEVLFVL